MELRIADSQFSDLRPPVSLVLGFTMHLISPGLQTRPITTRQDLPIVLQSTHSVQQHKRDSRDNTDTDIVVDS